MCTAKSNWVTRSSINPMSDITLEHFLSEIKLMRDSQTKIHQKVNSKITIVTIDVAHLNTKVDGMGRIISNISTSILWLRNQIWSGQQSAITFLAAMGVLQLQNPKVSVSCYLLTSPNTFAGFAEWQARTESGICSGRFGGFTYQPFVPFHCVDPFILSMRMLPFLQNSPN